MRIQAFQALRPTQETAHAVASLPYDVVSTSEAAQLAQGNPLSFFHVIRAEIDLPSDTPPHSDAVYQQARKTLERFQHENILQREKAPSLYIYRQQAGQHIQTGVTALAHIEDYENDIIRKHEKTRIEKENDRLQLNKTLKAHPEPVFLTYRDAPQIDALVARDTTAHAPLYDFTASDGVRHTLWRCAQPQAYVDAFAKIPLSYVADGHHRSASAARLGREYARNNPQHTGHEAYNGFPAVLFPASQLRILPYNRLVKDLNGHTPETLLQAIRKVCTVYENNASTPEKPGQISLYLQQRWFGLVAPERPDADPISRLDVSFLQDYILKPLLGIDDPRTSPRIDFSGGIRGTKELEKRVESGECACAFSMFPVTIDQLMDIADAGQIMPPKSTWFEPKLRSGLFLHTF